MTVDPEIRRTALHDVHVSAGARMVDFAGWRMPVQYTGVIDEHMAVRTRAGLFDVSHMGELEVRGPDALGFIQYLTSNNAAKLTPGRVQYSALTSTAGGFVDDILVYRLAEEEFLLVVNAANREKDFAWLLRHHAGFDVQLQDASNDWAQLALQGPVAQQILQPLVQRQDLSTIRYYAFARTEVDGVASIVSRTGYTGEDGFEIYAPPGEAERLWQALLDSGAGFGVAPIGLGARDTLRLEAKMALFGNDIDESTTVLEADLGWIVKLKKGDFIGRDVLARQKASGVERKLIGFEMRGRPVARPGYTILKDGRPVGTVTSGTFAPFLKRSIGLAYLPVSLTGVGTEFEVEIRGRGEPAVVVATPFYKRPR